jgi:hypothetical protein
MQVLGPNGRLDLQDWSIDTLYSCTEDVVTCSHGPRNDLLYSITVTPKHRLNLKNVHFPTVFSRRYGTASEIKVVCAIYSDASGMEYWIVSKPYKTCGVGDLLWVRYGPHS